MSNHDPLCDPKSRVVLHDRRVCDCNFIARVRADEREAAAERVAALPPDSSRSDEDGIGGLLNGVTTVTRAETFTYYVKRDAAVAAARGEKP